MTLSFLVVKSLDPPETVTDSLDLVSDLWPNRDCGNRTTNPGAH